MMKWTAKLAPLGVELPEGRILDPQGYYHVRAPAPVRLAHAGHRQGDIVGEVREVHVDGADLIASGVLLDPPAPDRIGELLPEVQLFHGQVMGLVLGDSPAFADVWFRLEGLPDDPATM